MDSKFWLSLLVGVIVGFLTHALTMLISFKKRTIENKIKIFDSLIAHWLKARNYIYTEIISNRNPKANPQYDLMYGESQLFIGETFLVCDDLNLSEKINTFNENFFRDHDWFAMQADERNKLMDEIKNDGIGLAKKMQDNIKNSTRFELRDFIYVLKGLVKL